MKKSDLRTPIIYILTCIIVILLIILKKMDDQNKNRTLEKRMEQLETKVESVKKAQKKKQHKLSPEEVPPQIKGKIAIIIDDFGYRNDEISDGFLDLNAALTYAIIPGHEHSRSFSEKAVNAGYEVIVHMPMENTGKTYGEEEFVLTTDMDNATITRRINYALAQIPAAIGMNNHQGSKASADQYVMSAIAKVLKKENKFFVDSRTTIETIAEATMEIYGVPTARRNVFLDNNDDEEEIKKQLMKLVRKAERDGSSIGIGHVKPKTLKVLQKQIPILQKQGFKFEFVSKMLH